MIRRVLERILVDYPAVFAGSLEAKKLTQFIRQDAPHSLEAALPQTLSNRLCRGGCGIGTLATVPWLAVFDPLVTDSATRGYYVVYLFNKDTGVIYLSLNQGATALRAEFRSRAPEVLRDRAALMRTRVHDFFASFDSSPIQLRFTKASDLPGDYMAGHAFGRRYLLDALPTEAELQADLQRIVCAYDALTHRGGLSASIAEDESMEVNGTELTITEKKQYHKRIERNAKGAALAKKHHGTTCQACGINYKDRFGHLGKGVIEAHHLRPLNTLEEGMSVKYNVVTDFAVLCANCHRMIHRTDDVGDLAAFKNALEMALT